jgi:hypothetical protein
MQEILHVLSPEFSLEFQQQPTVRPCPGPI